MNEIDARGDNSLLRSEDREFMVRPNQLDIGSYQKWGAKRQQCNFVVELDARPLAVLADAAVHGRRVYEFMSVRRPGDIFHYLYLRFVDVDEEVLRHFREHRKAGSRDIKTDKALSTEAPLVEFDRSFSGWINDDSLPFEVNWHWHRKQRHWREKAQDLLLLFQRLQDKLRTIDDFLLQHEISLIDRGLHRCDFLADTERIPNLADDISPASGLPAPLFTMISDLIKRDDVQSVSCPFKDYSLWRALVEEQVRRVRATGKSPQEVFGLSGPDSGLSNVPAGDWGGDIHIPYEGVCDGDLYIQPDWRRFFPERAGEDGQLRYATGNACHYLLINGDHGELGCATRTVIGDWVLYMSKAPYEPCNPFIGARKVIIDSTIRGT